MLFIFGAARIQPKAGTSNACNFIRISIPKQKTKERASRCIKERQYISIACILYPISRKKPSAAEMRIPIYDTIV